MTQTFSLTWSFWWAQVGSNHRPLACKASALPLSYAPKVAIATAQAYRQACRAGIGQLIGAGRADRRNTLVIASSTSSARPGGVIPSAAMAPRSAAEIVVAGSPTWPQSRHSTSPSRLTRRMLAQTWHLSRSATQSPADWQPGQISTWRSALTPRSHGLLPRSGSTCLVPHR